MIITNNQLELIYSTIEATIELSGAFSHLEADDKTDMDNELTANIMVALGIPNTTVD